VATLTLEDAFAEAIRQARKDAGLTQVELAERLGVTQNAVSHWERGLGLPEIRRIYRIERICGLRAGTMFAKVGASGGSSQTAWLPYRPSDLGILTLSPAA
jgi:transcriptional regulator with XRE-family HTH domain